MRAAMAGGTPYAQGSAMPCKPSSVSMMQIEQSALGTWKVALYHWSSGSWGRESESVRISVIFMGLLWRSA